MEKVDKMKCREVALVEILSIFIQNLSCLSLIMAELNEYILDGILIFLRSVPIGTDGHL